MRLRNSIVVDYPNRPPHRGHTVEVQDWNEDCVMILIRSDTHTAEALLTVEEMQKLLDAAKDLTHVG